MKSSALVLASTLLAVTTVAAAERTYPPLEKYLMPRADEIALARSAAPKTVSERATVKVLTKSGYETVAPGDNGAVCLVMRGWAGVRPEPASHDIAFDAALRAPICFDPLAARTVLPQEELRARLGVEGVAPAQIAAAVMSDYATGKLPKLEGVAFAYMWSKDQNLGPDGAWHPHMMIYAPYYRNEMLGGHAPSSGLPTVAGDDGSPFALVVVPVDDQLAIASGVPTGSTKHH
jgi:hypothetical protein